MKAVKLKLKFSTLIEHSQKHCLHWKSAHDSLLIKYTYFGFILNFKYYFPNSEGAIKGLFSDPVLVSSTIDISSAIFVMACSHLGVAHLSLEENSSHVRCSSVCPLLQSVLEWDNPLL